MLNGDDFVPTIWPLTLSADPIGIFFCAGAGGSFDHELLEAVPKGAEHLHGRAKKSQRGKGGGA
jgi:hypothetical protein